MDESIFPKAKKCNAVKIWSKSEMTDEKMLYGWSVFNQYQRDLVNGNVSESGCIYTNKFYMALARKTKTGICSVQVGDIND